MVSLEEVPEVMEEEKAGDETNVPETAADSKDASEWQELLGPDIVLKVRQNAALRKKSH